MYTGRFARMRVVYACEGEGVFVLKPFSSFFKPMHNLLSQFSLFCVCGGGEGGVVVCVCVSLLCHGFLLNTVLWTISYTTLVRACMCVYMCVCVCVCERESWSLYGCARVGNGEGVHGCGCRCVGIEWEQ